MQTKLFIYIIFILSLCGCSNSTEATTEITTEIITESTTETTTFSTVSLVMVGDILAHEGVYNSGKYPDGTYNYDHLFKNILDESLASDIAIANQEVILGGTELGLSAYPLFNSPTQIGDSLVRAGFNVICHASNHTLDKGRRGLDNALSFWKTSHPDITVLGVHDSQESYDNNSVQILNRNNIKIALMNYTYGTNGIPLPEPYSINLLDEEKVLKDLAYARENADFIVVCPHWGTEYTHTPTESQLSWARLFNENGADLVIGTHPHVIQPVEMLTGENGHSTLVYYSLGNFVSNQDKLATMLGAMAKVEISNEGGQAHISNYSVIPLVNHMLWGKGQITTYKLSDYTPELAAQNKIHSYEKGFSVDYLKSLSEQVFKELYSE